MAAEYFYINVKYGTEEEAQAAVIPFKFILDNEPTNWCHVKEITGSDASGWLVPVASLTDSEINNLDVAKTYLVCSNKSGLNEFPLNSSEATSAVLKCRTDYAILVGANNILKFNDGTDTELGYENITPNIDMSGYV
jgi:hypothetical protein